MKIVVTGVSGYIGGQIALQLRDAGHWVCGIDHCQPPKHLQAVCSQFLSQCFYSDTALNWLVYQQPDAVIHCAGSSLVGPSVSQPRQYFENNVTGSLKLINTVCELANCRLVFSSSAAAYGRPIMNPAQEVDPCEPISPYGLSKLMIEQILHWYHQAYGLDYVAFRFFNACGADPQGRHGQAPGATHIMARVLESLRDAVPFTLNGSDYDTADGTCVRDYVHVADIAAAHILALTEPVEPGVYNLGSSQGVSNLEIIAAAQRITGRSLTVIQGAARPGDPAVLTASADKFNRHGVWQKYDLENMIQHAWKWYVQ